jgi:predicted MPP superfamily phosphohydrolase
MAFPFGFVIAFSIMICLIAYTITEGCLTLTNRRTLFYCYLGFSVGYFLLFMISLLLSRRVPFSLARFLSIISNPYFFYFANLLVVFGLIDIVRLINLGAKFSSNDLLPFREWWLLGGLIAIFVTFWIGFLNFQCPRVREVDIAAVGVPRQGKTLRILVVSDIHLGFFVNKKRWQKWVDLLNGQKTDIIFLVGDIGDTTFSAISHQRMHEEFNLLQAPYGVYAVRGNHDTDELISYLNERTSVRFLRDSSELIDNSVYIVGRDDRSNPDRASIETLIDEFDRNKPIILLDHQPVKLKEAEENGITLQLSGHTHGGQFFPGTVFVPFIYENSHGLSRRSNTQYYVSSGLGVWGPPCRFTSNSEIVNITFRY